MAGEEPDKMERVDKVEFYLSRALLRNSDGEEIPPLFCAPEMVYCKETSIPIGPT